MIEYISGRFTEKTPTYAVIESGGVGYLIQISLTTFGAINELREGKLITHYSVSVDIRSGESRHQLFGFATALERQIFRQLVNISGISAHMAQVILSSFKPDEFQAVVLNGDAKSLCTVKGIGPKVAQKVIGELREKFAKEEQIADISLPAGNSSRQEALSALSALGFDRASSVKVINNILKEKDAPASVEDLIKRALKQL